VIVTLALLTEVPVLAGCEVPGLLLDAAPGAQAVRVAHAADNPATAMNATRPRGRADLKNMAVSFGFVGSD
jgi:hypothetical protein